MRISKRRFWSNGNRIGQPVEPALWLQASRTRCPRPDAFAESPRRPTPEERKVAELIFPRTRRAPIGIDLICREASFTKRQAQSVVESLRAKHHLPIGASKRTPTGYFWIRDLMDLEIALRNFLNPVKKMLATARAFAPSHLRAELRGQLVLLLSENDQEPT